MLQQEERETKWDRNIREQTLTTIIIFFILVFLYKPINHQITHQETINYIENFIKTFITANNKERIWNIEENIDDLIEKSKNIKGEIVLIIEENDNISNENKLNDLSIEEHYKYYEDKGYEKKEIIKLIAKDRNVNKNEIYKLFI